MYTIFSLIAKGSNSIDPGVQFVLNAFYKITFIDLNHDFYYLL